jgi:hypothetical protein
MRTVADSEFKQKTAVSDSSEILREQAGYN